MSKIGQTAAVSALAIVCFVAVCYDRHPGRPTKEEFPPPEKAWTSASLSHIEERLKAGKIDLAEAGRLALPIISIDPAFAKTAGDDDRHKAMHWVAGWFEDHPQRAEILRQYELATGCRYVAPMAYERLR